MFLYGTRQYNFLQVPTFAYEAGHRVFVRYAGNILLDNGTGIEVACYIMACCTNQFHTPFKSGMVGLGSDKGWQERMVYVDNAVGHTG